MSAIGHIGSYNADIGAFASYKVRKKQFFIANDIEAERQAHALISTIGVSGYKTLQSCLRRIHTRLLLLQLPMMVQCPAFIVISPT